MTTITIKNDLDMEDKEFNTTKDLITYFLENYWDKIIEDSKIQEIIEDLLFYEKIKEWESHETMSLDKFLKKNGNRS